VKKIIGKGSYGHVAKAISKKNSKPVAIKKITGLFEALPETRRILREIILLKNCRHPNIVQLLDVIIPKSQTVDNFEELYLVTEYCDSDLAKVFKIDGNYFKIEHIRHVSYQIMCGYLLIKLESNIFIQII
jgi:serine/threonine protein kinase